MIFVKVGTHEQQFNRLIKYIDELKSSGKLAEDVVMQTGYSTYDPQSCTHSDFLLTDRWKNILRMQGL